MRLSTHNIFVHISSFDKTISRRPKVGDTIFYYSHTDKDGKNNAVDAVIEGVILLAETQPRGKRRKPREQKSKSSFKSIIICVIVIIAISAFFFNRIENGTTLLSI